MPNASTCKRSGSVYGTTAGRLTLTRKDRVVSSQTQRHSGPRNGKRSLDIINHVGGFFQHDHVVDLDAVADFYGTQELLDSKGATLGCR